MKKLNLHRETIRNLSALDLQDVVGGDDTTGCPITPTCPIYTLGCDLSAPGKCVTRGPKNCSGITMPC